jgi:hypothetical protein
MNHSEYAQFHYYSIIYDNKKRVSARTRRLKSKHLSAVYNAMYRSVSSRKETVLTNKISSSIQLFNLTFLFTLLIFTMIVDIKNNWSISLFTHYNPKHFEENRKNISKPFNPIRLFLNFHKENDFFCCFF